MALLRQRRIYSEVACPNVFSPSKITAWLECATFSRCVTGPTPDPAGRADTQGELAELLVEKGSAHERDCLAD